MKKYLIIGFALLMLSARLPAQTGVTGNLTDQSTNCATTNSCIEIDVPQNVGGATIKLSGTFSGTAQFEVSGDPLSVPLASAVWVAISATPSNSITTVTSATAPGVWQVNISGYKRIRIRCSTYVSGTIAAAINLSTASARGGSGAGGGGTIGGSIANTQVAVGTASNTIGGFSTFTFQGTDNPDGLFIGPATSTLSSNLQLTSFFGVPAFQTNRHVASADSDTVFTGNISYDQTDKDLTANGLAVVIDSTANKTKSTTGIWGVTFSEVPSTFTNANVQAGVAGLGQSNGAGTTGTLTGFVGNAGNNGTGTVTGAIDFYAQRNFNSGGGTLTNSYGFFAQAQNGIAGTLNAEYFGATQGGGAPNYVFYNTQGISRMNLLQLDGLYSSGNVLSSSFTAPTIGATACGGAAASIVTRNGTSAFKVNIGTGNAGSCTVAMPTATTDWVCFATDITTISTTVSQTRVTPTSGSETTSITLKNYTDISGAGNWVDSDVLEVGCHAE